jgi:hypothetical protein
VALAAAVEQAEHGAAAGRERRPAASPASAAPAAIAGVPDFRAARVVLRAPCLTASAGCEPEPFADDVRAREPFAERRCWV